jgi:hypothetical protein
MLTDLYLAVIKDPVRRAKGGVPPVYQPPWQE